MSFVDRRNFIQRTAGLAITHACLGRGWKAAAQENPEVDALVVRPEWDKVIAAVPEDLLGLSYESSQLSSVDFFSAQNTELIRYFRKLSSHGVLRLGGNFSEFTVWTPKGSAVAVKVPFAAVGADKSDKSARVMHPVVPQAITNLREFLDLTGWRTVYGLNLALADCDRVVDEARFVARTLGQKLIAFQIGNEPDHYVMNGLRSEPYEFADYFREWSKVHDAVLKALPGASFAGPDIAERQPWIDHFAKAAPSSVSFLTGHYYAEGPPTDPSMTLERLLHPNPHLETRMEATREVVRTAHLPYVMAETNSCFNGGKPGVSDVFGSALWALNYALQLAAEGARGVYFHGGGDGWYTPIAGGTGQPFHERPIFSGLRMCKDLLGSNMVSVSLAGATRNVTVYGFQNRKLVVVNSEPRAFVLRLSSGEHASSVVRMTAPSPEAKTDIEVSTASSSSAMLVPAYSAAIFEFRRA